MIGETLSHYRILGKLGEGGMGEVFEAEDTTLGRRVALKLLPEEMTEDPERLRRFEREAQVVASLNHPSIVTLYSVEEDSGRRFITMELVEGQSLEDLLPPRGVDLAKFFDIALPLASALTAAHEKGITHRDLKPANVMVGNDGRIKVLDFGLAKLQLGPGGEDGADLPTRTLTQQGMVMGTVPYMAPEQVQGQPADPRADLFALGVIFYELLTGRRPFRGDTSAEIISAILRDAPPAVTDVRVELPDQLARVLKRCLEKHPGRRYQSARDLARDLEEVAESADQAGKAGPSTAVLPFADLSPEKDQGYFCEGIAEELINALVKIDGLRVASRIASFQLKDTELDLQEIGNRLHVSTVLSGSVRKAGDRVRVTAQLVNVADGYHLWSERYDRKLEDIFAIQDEITESIVEALQVTLGPGEKETKEQKRKEKGTTDVQAYDYYLRGRQFFYQFRKEGFDFARQMFARAIVIDPTYARAYAGVADCCSFLYMYFEANDDNLREADRASRQAIEMEPESAEANASRGLALSLSKKFDQARAVFEKAIELDPKLYEARYLFARALFAQGELEEARSMFEQAAKINPEDYQAPYFAAMVLKALERPEEARAGYERALEVIERHLELNPDDSRAMYLGAGVLVFVEEHEKALEWAQKATLVDAHNPATLYNVACVYSNLGEKERAIDCLEESIVNGMSEIGWLDNDPDLDPLREEPRFQALIERARRKSASGATNTQ